MDEQILITLELLKTPKIKIINKAMKKQTQLFEADSPIDIQFNGYHSLSEYKAFLDSQFHKCKLALQSTMRTFIQELAQLKSKLEAVLLEIKLFRKMFFPKNNQELLFTRIEFLKSSLPIENYGDYLKKS